MKRPRKVTDWISLLLFLSVAVGVVYLLGWVLVFP
jgi:hypothetical protein